MQTNIIFSKSIDKQFQIENIDKSSGDFTNRKH